MTGELVKRIARVLEEETGQMRPHLHAVSLVSRLLPPQVASRVRARLLRGVGFELGERTRFAGAVKIIGGDKAYSGNLVVGDDCMIDVGCTFDVGAKITLGDRVTVGHQVIILTSTHELGPREHRAGKVTVSPVTIADGAWLGPRCIILPGVTVGEGAVVAPGAVVNKDVAPHTRVGGSPAKPLEALEP